MDSILFDPDLSQRRALILALGTYEIGEIPQSDRQPIIETLLAEFRNHPDAGVHGAAEWTLRRWGLDREVERAEVDLQQADGTGKRWFVTKSGSTMISIHGRVSVSMGSPRDETGHTPAESRPYQNLITRRFALAAKELTRSQFQQFLADRSLQGDETDEYPGGPDAPQIALNWFRAAEYCDWLSQREGLQPCYRPNAEGYYGVGMGIRPDFLDRNGYRMPTVAEWEYACRAGTTTAWYCGDAVEQLGGYAWHEGNSAIRIHPVGRLKPNDLGFFDIHGNASEWTSDPPFYHHPAVDAPPALDTWYFMINDQGDRRLRKGGCAESRAVAARSALAESYQSSNNYKLSGLRIARTLK